MIYLGTLGRMVGIKCPASQNVESEDRYAFDISLEGKRIAQRRQRTPRSWSLQSSDATTPRDMSVLQQFVAGEWGPGPFHFVSVEAPVTNMLTPDVAACLWVSSRTNIRAGGPVDLGADGIAGRSYISEDPTNPANGLEIYAGLDFTPVIPGQSVTGSAYVRGTDVRVSLYWYDAGLGSPIGSVSSGPVTDVSRMQRVSIAGVPPAGAVACRVVVSGASQMTRPAITWTEGLYPWASGEGCQKAVVSSYSKSPVLFSQSYDGPRYSSMNFTVTEVG